MGKLELQSNCTRFVDRKKSQPYQKGKCIKHFQITFQSKLVFVFHSFKTQGQFYKVFVTLSCKYLVALKKSD